MRHRHSGRYLSRTPRGRVVYKIRPIHNNVLKSKYRKIFQNLDKQKFETGGYMDFNDKGLERADVFIGRKGSVDIDISPDKEIDYHSHPHINDKYVDKLNHFPSTADIKSSHELPTQSMIIFHDGVATVATKNENFGKGTSINKIEKGLTKDAHKKSLQELFKKYKPEYKKAGFDLEMIKADKDIKLPISIVEPVKDKAKFGDFFYDPDEASEPTPNLSPKEERERYLEARKEKEQAEEVEHWGARATHLEDPKKVRELYFETTKYEDE